MAEIVLEQDEYVGIQYPVGWSRGLAEAIRLHARGFHRPWRVEDMVTVLKASGFSGRGVALESNVRMELHRRASYYRALSLGLYEWVGQPA